MNIILFFVKNEFTKVRIHLSSRAGHKSPDMKRPRLKRTENNKEDTAEECASAQCPMSSGLWPCGGAGNPKGEQVCTL